MLLPIVDCQLPISVNYNVPFAASTELLFKSAIGNWQSAIF
jgi:hypothetical protein